MHEFLTDKKVGQNNTQFSRNDYQIFRTKKPLTRVSEPVPGVYGKRGLERGWQKRLAKCWRRVGERLAKGWHRVGEEGLAKGWQRVGGFPCTLQLCNSRDACLESGSPKPHPSRRGLCNMPQAKTEVALQLSECCAAEVALQHSLFCSAEVVFYQKLG